MANQNKRTILKSKLNNLHQANGTETPYIGVPFAGVISLPLFRYTFCDTFFDFREKIGAKESNKKTNVCA